MPGSEVGRGEGRRRPAEIAREGVQVAMGVQARGAVLGEAHAGAAGVVPSTRGIRGP